MDLINLRKVVSKNAGACYSFFERSMLYVHIYMYTCTYVYVYIYTFVYIYTYVYICTYVYIYIHIRIENLIAERGKS